MIYLCQQNAWMDEEAMIVWVDDVFRPPYIETEPDGVLPILFLDAYRCHMMASVVGRIQDLRVEVEHIPGGCTSLCQPVDIGVNKKPFKNRIRRQWEEWMNPEGLANGTTLPPTRQNIIEWTRIAMNSLPARMIQNAWRHGLCSWFPLAAAEQPPDAQHAADEEAIPAALDVQAECEEDEESNTDSVDI